MPTSRKRKPNKHPKKVIKERVIKFVGKLSEKSKEKKFINKINYSKFLL